MLNELEKLFQNPVIQKCHVFFRFFLSWTTFFMHRLSKWVGVSLTTNLICSYEIGVNLVMGGQIHLSNGGNNPRPKKKQCNPK